MTTDPFADVLAANGAYADRFSLAGQRRASARHRVGLTSISPFDLVELPRAR
jgi:hypothetical protein